MRFEFKRKAGKKVIIGEQNKISFLINIFTIKSVMIIYGLQA